jgi:hypothetical protein
VRGESFLFFFGPVLKILSFYCTASTSDIHVFAIFRTRIDVMSSSLELLVSLIKPLDIPSDSRL